MSRSAAARVMKTMDRVFELELVRRLRAGDTDAFDGIYDEFQPRLYAFLQRMARNSAVAEDLLEETWLRVVSAAPRLDPETRLAPWLFTIARNLYVNYCRSRAREQSYTSEFLLLWPDTLSPSPFDSAASNQFEQHMEAALAALPAKYREALLLVAVEGLRPADAAGVCGISPEAFRQRLSRARALVSRQLKDTGWMDEFEERTYERRSTV